MPKTPPPRKPSHPTVRSHLLMTSETIHHSTVELFRERAVSLMNGKTIQPLLDILDREVPQKVRPNPPMPYLGELLMKNEHYPLVQSFVQDAVKHGLSRQEAVKLLENALRVRFAQLRKYPN